MAKKKEKSLQLLTAKETLEITKTTYTKEFQLQSVIKDINRRLKKDKGATYAFIGDGKELYQETIDTLLEKEYDLYMFHGEDSFGWDNIVYCDEKASGKIRETTYLAEDDE